MGHREDLLDGAKKCLYKLGYARTTARDIVEASGTNLGSIGYHYGSKEELLDVALIEIMEAASTSHTAGLLDQLSSPSNLAGSFEEYTKDFTRERALLVSQVEAWAQLEHSPRLREKLAEFYQREIDRVVDSLRDSFPEQSEERIRLACEVSSILGDGLQVRWLVDPDQVPSGSDIAAGLRYLADAFEGGATSRE